MGMEYIKKVIQSDHERNRIFNKIVEKNRSCWKRFASSAPILSWLRNFSSKREIYLALVLADNIMYYTSNEIRSLWKLILTNRLKQFLLNEIFPNGTSLEIETWFPEYLRRNCVFVGFGKAGKSGQSMPYHFKKSHGIRNLTYMEFFEVLCLSQDLKDKEWVLLLDDFIGSGNQARDQWYGKTRIGEKDSKSLDDVSKENSHLKFIYLALVGCEEGKRKIERTTPMKVILGEELDESFKCFSDVSNIYTDPNERNDAKRVMEKNGRMLYNRYPLGYDNMELAIAFCHNTPDNSLPVIWKRLPDGGWVPLFERVE